MPDVRYVCLSDLHFGAENSLLTHIELSDTDVTVDPTKPSKTLRAFVACLRAVVAANSARAPKPTLILAGDVIEFALANDNVAATAFERFIELAFPPDDEGGALFDSEIVYLPGNHDHHMWETAREQQYADYIRRHPGQAINPPWHGTSMLHQDDESKVESELLAAVLHHMGRDDLRLVVRYPNLGLVAPSGRLVAIHHGHFTEKIYLLMSELQQALFPGQAAALAHGARTEAAWDWEAANFAWIDFFWSTLGRSGEWGADVGLIYDMLRNEEAQRLMARNLARFLLRKRKAWVRVSVEWLLALVLRPVLRWTKRLEREAVGTPGQPLTDKTRRGLTEYVNGPLLEQLRAEGMTTPPEDLVFVFGHTHKPFEESWEGYRGGRMDVYNSGGWVVDTLDPETRQGAAAVLLSEDLAVASLRLYNQKSGADEYRVEVHSVDADPRLADHVRGLIDPAAPPWADLSRAVADAVPQRCRALGFIIQHGIAALEASPAS